MSTEQEVLIAQHDEKLVRMMEQAHASSLLQVDSMKLRIAHHEKLIVLCAGTLALSFTAATSFHGQQNHEIAAIPSLLRAWQLLLSAIVLGVVSNWMSVTGVAHLTNYASYKQVGVYFTLLEKSLTKLAPQYSKDERESWDRNSAKYIRVEKVSNILIRLAAVLGLLAQIAAFCAFVSLYFFAKYVITNN